MKRFLFAAALAVALAAVQPVPAAAQFSNAPTAQAPRYSAEQVIAFSKKVEKELAARGARVAIIARVGRAPEEMPAGMHYTHAGFAVYSDITTADGRHLPGFATFNDYQGDEQPDTSSLVQDYPVDFYASVMRLEAGVVIPSPELQRRLLAFIGTPGYAALHQRDYSAIANPFTLGKQNCTEFVLDVVQAAIYGTSDIRVIKANTRAYFEPQQVQVGGFKLLLGSIFSREISLSDHPSLPAVTATFESIARYLQKYDQGSQVFTVLPD
jgi:hypothetical protein